MGSVEYPAFTAAISSERLSNGLIMIVDRTSEIIKTARIRITSRSMAFLLNIPSVVRIVTVLTLARRTPLITPSSSRP